MDLRRHRGAHNLFGTGQCRRLAKLVPNLAADNGTAALLNHPFVEWLAAPIIFCLDEQQLQRRVELGVGELLARRGAEERRRRTLLRRDLRRELHLGQSPARAALIARPEC